MISRRKFIGAIGAVGAVCGCRSVLGEVPRHRSDYAGIRIGAITYSFAQMSEFPRGCTEKFILGAGLGSVELMDRDFERDLGIVPFRHIQAKFLTKEQKAAISQWRETADMKPLEDFRDGGLHDGRRHGNDLLHGHAAVAKARQHI